MKTQQWLEALGIPKDCISRSSSAKEKKSSFSIRPQPGDEVWRVKVDDGWFSSNDGKKVDYLFWAKSKRGRKLIVLVELKGIDLRKALQQVEATLKRLCKQSPTKGIHTGAHRASSGHDLTRAGGVRVVIILSSGQKVPRRQRELERLRRKYKVRVHICTKRLFVKGVDALP